MRLLFDENLSWRLVEMVKVKFPNCVHISDTTLKQPPSDIAIWKYCAENNLIIVTNDDDFFHLLQVKGFPPKVVLLKIGNAKTQTIADTLMQHYEDIRKLAANDKLGLIEIFKNIK